MPALLWQHLWHWPVDGTSPFSNGDDGVVALGYISETAASLIPGASTLIAERNPYAAASLVRQLVEIEYLAWAFAEDQEEASSWLRSSRADRLQHWQPGHLRQRSQGRFRGTDYAEHCDLGGHPTPQGVRTLIADNGPIRNSELIVSEAAHHGSSTWHYAYSAQTILGDASASVGSRLNETVTNSEELWRHQDQLASTWLTIRGQDGSSSTS